MTDRRRNKRLKTLRTCFINSDAGPKKENRVTVIGHNQAHERRLVEQLVNEYGWALGHDGSLYPAQPVAGRNVA